MIEADIMKLGRINYSKIFENISSENVKLKTT